MSNNDTFEINFFASSSDIDDEFDKNIFNKLDNNSSVSTNIVPEVKPVVPAQASVPVQSAVSPVQSTAPVQPVTPVKPVVQTPVNNVAVTPTAPVVPSVPVQNNNTNK